MRPTVKWMRSMACIVRFTFHSSWRLPPPLSSLYCSRYFIMILVKQCCLELKLSTRAVVPFSHHVEHQILWKYPHHSGIALRGPLPGARYAARACCLFPLPFTANPSVAAEVVGGRTQGCLKILTLGDTRNYETIDGGSGAGPSWEGQFFLSRSVELWNLRHEHSSPMVPQTVSIQV
jgi:hypothetical protein